MFRPTIGTLFSLSVYYNYVHSGYTYPACSTHTTYVPKHGERLKLHMLRRIYIAWGAGADVLHYILLIGSLLPHATCKIRQNDSHSVKDVLCQQKGENQILLLCPNFCWVWGSLWGSLWISQVERQTIVTEYFDKWDSPVLSKVHSLGKNCTSQCLNSYWALFTGEVR